MCGESIKFVCIILSARDLWSQDFSLDILGIVSLIHTRYANMPKSTDSLLQLELGSRQKNRSLRYHYLRKIYIWTIHVYSIHIMNESSVSRTAHPQLKIKFLIQNLRFSQLQKQYWILTLFPLHACR